MSVVAPICALCVLSIHLSDDECQEIPDEFSSTNYGEKLSSEIMVKIPDDITLTLQKAKYLEKTSGTSHGAKYPANFLLT